MNRQSMNRGAAEVEELRYGEWEMGIASQVKREVVWKFYGYRKALFLYDLCWQDCEELLKHPLGRAVAQQLIRSAGSSSANIE